MNRYRFALSCIHINKHEEAESALLIKEKGHKVYDYVPNGAYGFYLLGVISEKFQKFCEAKEYYSHALDLNPTLWSAY